jgi:adenine-specific DNA-methyltransferase
MATNKELQAELSLLRAQNKELLTRVSSFFIRTPEDSEASEKLRKGCIPFLQQEDKLSYRLNSGEPETFLIEGDNLAALTTLGYSHENKVDVIYIDPPYNTGKRVYTYSDSYGDNRLRDVFKDSFLKKHSAWLTYMETRLTLARGLLRDSGIIIVSIGVSEHAQLRLLMDAVFGEDNFVSNVTWTGALKNNARYVSESSDYMLIYAKDIATLHDVSPKWRAKKHHAQHIINMATGFWEDNDQDIETATKELRRFYKTQEAKDIFTAEPGLKMYNTIDENGRVYRAGDLSSPNGVGADYDVINPHNNKKVALPKRGWAYSEATFKEKIEADEILWNEDNVPAYKRYLDQSLSVVLKDSIRRDRDAANKLLHKIIGNGKFSYPKDHYVLAEWIDYVMPEHRKNDLEDPPVILDFFAGSGSTAHAVAELNANDGGKRTCILITSEENDIARNVAAPRMEAILSGKWVAETKPEMSGSLKFCKVFYASSKHEPKKEWAVVPYSSDYITYVKSTINELKHEGML